MPDELSERLSRFTPDASALDRDGLLFAAGRVSARPSRWWQALAGTLAVAQVATVLLLWPRPAPPVAPASLATAPLAVEPTTTAPPQESELWMLSRRIPQGEGDNLPPPLVVDDVVPSDPPLHAFGDMPLLSN